ncbi:MAG: hypothetical protein GY755_10690, partial [Chloroflexi bacterium]|nr:hypothetical protein [Chloroflexota bacterium]
MNRFKNLILIILLALVLAVNIYGETDKPVITVTEPTDGTCITGTGITVSGEVTDESAVTLKINGNSVALTEDAFNTTVILTEGVNQITLQAEDAGGNTATRYVEVIADNTAPAITVEYPLNNVITNKEKLTLTGKINDANPLSIAIGSTQGEVIGTHFNFGEFILQEGENTL